MPYSQSSSSTYCVVEGLCAILYLFIWNSAVIFAIAVYIFPVCVGTKKPNEISLTEATHMDLCRVLHAAQIQNVHRLQKLYYAERGNKEVSAQQPSCKYTHSEQHRQPCAHKSTSYFSMGQSNNSLLSKAAKGNYRAYLLRTRKPINTFAQGFSFHILSLIENFWQNFI